MSFVYKVTKSLRARRNALMRALLMGKHKSTLSKHLSTLGKKSRPENTSKYARDKRWLAKI
jgi:hypothetical protein